MKSVREKYREQVKLDSTETTFIVLYNCLGLLPLAFALVPSSLAPILASLVLMSISLLDSEMYGIYMMDRLKGAIQNQEIEQIA